MRRSLPALCVALLLVASVAPAFGQAAGCCQLPRIQQTEADGTPLPFPFPIIPWGGCYQTDNAERCEGLGGTHYQLGVCAGGVCQPTAPGGLQALLAIPQVSCPAPASAPALSPPEPAVDEPAR